MRICSLASGSKGNSILVESNYTRILVDAGLSSLQIKTRLESIGVDPKTIDAIVLTHSHRDHVGGASLFSRQFDAPIHAHPDTLDHIHYLFKKRTEVIPWKGTFTINDLVLNPFRVSHDAIPTVGYLISESDKNLAICTDLGIITSEVTENLQVAQFIILESNHDPDMLLNGPYPWDIKERIASRVGHLSNHDTGQFLKSIMNGKLQQILLAHLSDENNTLPLARNTVLEYLGHHHETMLDIIEQQKVSPWFQL